MIKYKVLFDDELEDPIFDDYEDASDYGLYLVSCSREGADILELSNPGDYPLDEFVEPDFEVVEVEA